MTTIRDVHVADLLRLVRLRLAEPECWTQGMEASTERGECGDVPSLNPTDDRARCWCLDGACQAVAAAEMEAPNVWPARAAMRGRLAKAITAWMAAHDEASYTPENASPRLVIADWNDRDHRTHADVLEVLDAAIADAEAA